MYSQRQIFNHIDYPFHFVPNKKNENYQYDLSDNHFRLFEFIGCIVSSFRLNQYTIAIVEELAHASHVGSLQTTGEEILREAKFTILHRFMNDP